MQQGLKSFIPGCAAVPEAEDSLISPAQADQSEGALGKFFPAVGPKSPTINKINNNVWILGSGNKLYFSYVRPRPGLK